MTRKAALIIGGARRIGRAVSLEFAGRGYGVAVNARRSHHEAEETVGLISAVGGVAVKAMGDASDPAGARAAADAAIAAFGRLDAVVYCAAIRVHAGLEELTPDAWAEAISSVLTGAFQVSQAAAPHLKVRGGSITLMSGASAFVGAQGPATPAAKSGLVGMARALAVELGPHAVRVNVLSPGRIEAEGDAADYRARLERGRPAAIIPLRRAGTVSDIARVAAALASDDFAYVTGQTIHVNGGFYMG